MPANRIETLADGVTLYLGDCREILSTLGNVDAVVTDPPYGIEGSSGFKNLSAGKGNYSGAFEDTPEYIRNIVVPSIRIGLALAKRGAITPGHKCGSLYPAPAIIGGFYQPAATGLCVWGSCNFQPIFFYGRDPRIGRTIEPIARVLNETASEATGHPCAKPYKPWRWLVRRASLPWEMILDPFMGSGTTGVAAVKLGRKFIGIEIEPKYFDIACRRISEALKQPDLFIETPKMAKQEMLEL